MKNGVSIRKKVTIIPVKGETQDGIRKEKLRQMG